MVRFEEMEQIIQEWFADHSTEGVEGIAKVYATILKEADRQLAYMSSQFVEKGEYDQ